MGFQNIFGHRQKIIFAALSGPGYIAATGGTVTRDGDYLVHTFTGSGTFTITALSSSPALNNISYLLIGGGASGGNSISGNGGAGGGGAGDFITGTFAATLSINPVLVGSGGAASPVLASQGNNGNVTSFIGINSIGGGYGASGADTAFKIGGNGASGGGGGYYLGTKGFATGVRGNDGANATGIIGGGGGGSRTTGSLRNGGNGDPSSISGVSLSYCGGGGAGTNDSPTSQGGIGGGGNGANLTLFLGSTAGAINTGSGGGAGYGTLPSSYGSNGGSGIVIIRYFKPL